MHLTSRSPADPVATAATDERPLSRWTLVALTLGFAAVFALDWHTDAAPVQHLYYLPILLAAWRFRLAGGVAGSVVAIVLYHLANPRLLSSRHQEIDLLQVALFVAVGLVAAKLAHNARQLHTLAMTDDLTGLHNLRSFEWHLAAMVAEARRTGGELALLVLDLDRLKSLNDAHGHLAGAEAVRTVGRLIAAGLPPEAVACRYGGDEFVIALPRASRARAHEIAAGLRHAVHAATPVLADVAFPAGTLSVSIGLAARAFHADMPERDAEAGETLFRRADEALYVAKAQGRNRVHAA